MFSTSGLYLAIAILGEIVATSALKATDGMTKPGPTAIVVLGYSVSFYVLSKALRVIPVGIAYAIWSGVGTVLVTAISWYLFKQRLEPTALVGMVLVVLGVVLINMSGSHA
jgi:multidrug transporter EmrE-like cation transporter